MLFQVSSKQEFILKTYILIQHLRNIYFIRNFNINIIIHTEPAILVNMAVIQGVYSIQH